MSHYMTALAMKQRGLKPATKIVLYWLADHHNGETGDCFPSHKRLADLCECSDRDVRRQIKKLVDLGLVSIQARNRDNGSQASNAYVLHLGDDGARTNSPAPKDTLSDPPRTHCPTPNLGNNNLGIEPNLYPSDDRFADFWEMYPRKIGKAQAQKRWRLCIKTVPAETILDGLRSQLPILKEKETQFIPHASTWLNQERWNDEPCDLGKPAETRTTGNRGAHDSLVAGFANYASRQSD